MDLPRLFKYATRDDSSFLDALAIVKANSSGKIWLTGSYLYRLLASYLYPQGMDLRYWRFSTPMDFMVDTFVELRIPEGWGKSSSVEGNTAFFRKESSVPAFYILPLANVPSIRATGAEVTIENYLREAPLTVQSLAYDIYQQRLLGEVGIRALLEKSVGVHHVEAASYYAQRKGQPIDEIITQKVQQLGFTPVLL